MQRTTHATTISQNEDENAARALFVLELGRTLEPVRPPPLPEERVLASFFECACCASRSS